MGAETARKLDGQVLGLTNIVCAYRKAGGQWIYFFHPDCKSAGAQRPWSARARMSRDGSRVIFSLPIPGSVGGTFEVGFPLELVNLSALEQVAGADGGL